MTRTILQKTSLWLLAIGGALLADPCRAVADSLGSQAWDGTGSAYASQNDTAFGLGNFVTAYDNFSLASPTVVNSVTWAGEYINPGSPVNDLITAFTLRFYSDADGIPGGLLASDTISCNANETFLGVGNAVAFPVYSYFADISAISFTASAGTQYWLSIVSDLAVTTGWGWATGTGGDSNSYQSLLGTGADQPNDLAFELDGSTQNTAVPEPSSLALLAIGGIGLGFVMFRQRMWTV